MDRVGFEPTTSAEIIVVSAIIGIATGATEEILWRGVYIRKFPRSKFFPFVYPAIWFALWHIAPQSVMPNRFAGGIASFLSYALLLGISWGYVAWKNGSIRWVVLAHGVHDFLGLSGFTLFQYETRQQALLCLDKWC